MVDETGYEDNARVQTFAPSDGLGELLGVVGRGLRYFERHPVRVLWPITWWAAWRAVQFERRRSFHPENG